MSFQSDLRRFALNTGIRTDQVVRKVCLDLTRDLVKLTPVGNPDLWQRPAPPGYVGGHARSNYFFGISRNGAKDQATDKTGAPSLTRSAQFAGNLKAGGTFYITNNLPYILQITQFGTSQQAAPGSLTALTANWQARLDRLARSL